VKFWHKVTYGVFDEILSGSNVLEQWVLRTAYSIWQSLLEKLIKLVLVLNGVARL
jgi:hypothetical protein